MARKISKKNQQLFKKRVIELLMDFNYTEGVTLNYQWCVETPIGQLSVTLHDEQSTIYSVFMKFENIELAKHEFNCCNSTGIYNIHESDMDDALMKLHKALLRSKYAEVMVV